MRFQIDTLTAIWAVQRLLGVACPISATYNAQQLADQLKDVKCKALFISAPLVAPALEAAALAGLPKDRIYVLEVPEKATKGVQIPSDLKTVNDSIARGRDLSPLKPIVWGKDEGTRRTALLCSSSGTSGFPVSW
jgi:acyl-CoA synthetase (AMP-forming)/AMP-acid ligase II